MTGQDATPRSNIVAGSLDVGLMEGGVAMDSEKMPKHRSASETSSLSDLVSKFFWEDPVRTRTLRHRPEVSGGVVGGFVERGGGWFGAGPVGARLASGEMTECSQSSVHDCCFPRGPQSCQRPNAHERKM